MALILADRVKQESTTTGTGNIVFSGGVDGFQAFSAVCSTNDTLYYAIEDKIGTNFEIGHGTFNSSGQLERTNILQSSNSDNAVNFGAGTKNVFITYPADKAVFQNFDGSITIPSTIDGRDLATDGTKLDGIESSATADQTASEIRSLVESASDSNVFTDADHTKLNGIEASATADQTNDEIKAAVEAASDSNTFTDADHTKLNGIEASATADQTKSEIEALNINADTLDGQHGSYYTGYADTAVSNLVDSSPTALNTLNELAAALGDDANFSTTVNNNIATKLPLAGGTMTGNIAHAGDFTIGVGGDLNLDVAGDIILDANDDQIIIKDNGTAYGGFNKSSNDFNIFSSIQDGDIVFTGDDGGSGITALTLDMSNSGRAVFNQSVFVGNHLYLGDSKKAIFGAGEDLNIQSDGTNGQINAVNGTLTLDVAGDINLDAGGSDISLQGGGAEYGKFNLTGNSLNIHSSISDGDIVFKGSDGGSAITALTLDMSNGGQAIFNKGITVNDHVYFGDDDKAVFGGSNDLEIYHNGTDNYIYSNNKTLRVQGNGSPIKISPVNAELSAEFKANDSVDLYFDNSKKFETSATGATLTGNLAITGTVDGVDIATRDGVLTSTTTTANAALPKTGGTMTGNLTMGANEIFLSDNGGIRLGNSEDLQIVHNGTDSIIKDHAAGNLRLETNGNGVYLINSTDDEFVGKFLNGAAGYLYFDGNQRFETTSSGTLTTGNIAVTGTVDGRDVATDGSKLDGIESSANVTDTANVTSAGALMDSEIASLASVKAINQGLSTTSSPSFADLTVSGATPDFTIIDSDAGYTAKMLFQQVGGASILKTFSHSNDGEFIIMGGASSTEHFKVNSSGHITVSGDLTLTGSSHNVLWDNSNNSLDFADSAQLRFGASADLKIFHDGSNSHIVDSGTGNLKIATNHLQVQSGNGNNSLINAVDGGAVDLFHNNSVKLATNASGVQVIGTLTPDEITMEDNQKLKLGNSGDLEIYHDGTNSFIKDVGTGGLFLRGDTVLGLGVGSESAVRCTINNDVKLYYDDVERAKTTSSGFAVTGELTCTGNMTSSNNVTAYSDIRLKSDIKTIDNALDKVSQMRGVTFTKDGVANSGVIAQEFEKIAPELVKTADDEMGTKSVAYGNTVGYLIEAIKELKAEVEELKSKKNCECE